MEDVKFDLNEVDRSFVKYRKGDFVDALVIQKRDDGVVVNIGGKNDAFASKDEFLNFDKIKIGDVFKALIEDKRNDENMVVVSKRKADDYILNRELANTIKIGSVINFNVNKATAFGVNSNIGNYNIFVPIAQLSTSFIRDTSKFLGKDLSAVVTEMDNDHKKIVASCRVVLEQESADIKNRFFTTYKENDVVEGEVKRVVQSGAIIVVDFYDCFVPNFELDYIKPIREEMRLHDGDKKQFVILQMDRETGRVTLGRKQLFEDPRISALCELVVGNKYDGEVIKLLNFGAILRLENGAEGLLHISNLTQDLKKPIHELVRVGDKIEVYVKDIDKDNFKVSFSTYKLEE